MAALSTAMSFAQSLVTPPSTAAVESWFITSRMTYSGGNEEVAEAMDVVFDGNDVYFKFPNPMNGGAWVKGTKSGDSYVFANGQFQGNYGNNPFYFCGTSDGEAITDVTFSYNSDTKAFTATCYVLMNSTVDTFAPYCYFYPVVITKDEPVVEEVVTAPSDLQTEDWVFKASNILYESDGSVAGMESVTRSVKVGFTSSNEVYIQGLFSLMPTAWIKGQLQEGEITFTQGQLVLSYPAKVYMAGQYFGELSDFVCDYDATSKTIKGGSRYLVFNSSKTTMAPYEVYAGITISKPTEKVATPANPTIIGWQPYDDSYGYAMLKVSIDINDTDGTPMVADKMSYQIYTDINGTVAPYEFKKSVYLELPEATMTEIPYTFADNYDFFAYGEQIAFYEDSKEFQRIGVQVIYRGGGVEQRSDIVWLDLVGSNAIAGDANGDGEVNITDVTYILDKINGKPSADLVETAADANSDGEINITDVTVVLDIINASK